MKASKLFWVLLVVLLSAVLVIGCSSDDEEENDTVSLTTEYQTLYLLVSSIGIDQSTVDGAGSDLEGFHFKNLSDHVVGFVIQEIFTNDTKSETGKTVVFKWEGSAEAAGNSNYWGFGAGTVENSEWSSGEIAAPVAPDVETYITGFGTPAFVGKTYVGIKVKNLSATVKGDDITFVPVAVNPLTDRAFKLTDKFKK